MKSKDFIFYTTIYIYKNLSTFWKKGMLKLDYDLTRKWGVESLNEISDYHFESLVWKAPFTVDLAYDTENYFIKIKAKNWHEPRKGFFLYKYYVDDELVYIGRTVNPVKRFFEHLNEDDSYGQINKIEIHECNNKSDMIFLERLLIAKHNPPWNIVDSDNGMISFSFPEITFKPYNVLEFVSQY